MSLVKQKMVKAKMQTATLARHSCMKTSSDEQKAREKRRQAQDNPAQRAKKATPLMHCPECDRQYSLG